MRVWSSGRNRYLTSRNFLFLIFWSLTEKIEGNSSEEGNCEIAHLNMQYNNILVHKNKCIEDCLRVVLRKRRELAKYRISPIFPIMHETALVTFKVAMHDTEVHRVHVAAIKILTIYTSTIFFWLNVEIYISPELSRGRRWNG